MKRIFMVMGILPLCLIAMQEDVAQVLSGFNGNDYLAGKKTPFDPNSYVDYKKQGNPDFLEPIKGAGILPVVRDENGQLHAILAQAIVENGKGQNGKSLVYITPSQDSAFDYESAVDMASRAEELQVLDAQAFHPEKVEAAIYKAYLALPGNGLIRGGYGTMSYVAEFDVPMQKVRGFCHSVQPKLDAIAAIVDADKEKKAYNELFPTSAQIERSDRIRSFHTVPFNALLGAISKADTDAKAQQSWIQAPVQVEGHGAVASYVARTLAFHVDKLSAVK